ncbi:MAG: hypothetical protein ACRETQ_05085 [Gammaproteobacteria bacterium]
MAALFVSRDQLEESRGELSRVTVSKEEASTFKYVPGPVSVLNSRFAVLALSLALIVFGSGTAFASGILSILPTHTFQDADNTVGDYFGNSVAISGNGSEALIGSPGATVDGMAAAGKAYLYTQSNGTWSATPVVTFPDPTLQLADAFGANVQLSADGSVAVISSGSSAGNNEFVYVYGKNNGVWSTTPVIQLTNPDPTPATPFGDDFGYCTSLSADGNSVLVGADSTQVNGVPSVGRAYIFTQTGGVWSDTPDVTFTNPGDVKGDEFGCGALNADGTVAIITTVYGHSLGGTGRVFIFTQSGGVWDTTPTAVFTAGQTGSLGEATVALSGNGDLALLGVGNANANAGAAYFYAASNGVWPATPTVTLDSPAPTISYFGSPVALSGNGTVALIVGSTIATDAASSAVYLYTETGDAWADTPDAMLVDPHSPKGSSGYDFGLGLASSESGGVVIVGAPDPPVTAVGIAGGTGAAYIYNEPSAGWASPTPAPAPTTTAAPAPGAANGGGALGVLGLSALLGLLIRTKHRTSRSPRRKF